ncbi:MAG: hypothetical protein MI717_09855 [Spirochaetales bacterium]|nr:hypothetical protein [Spirochaetales bacterium]
MVNTRKLLPFILLIGVLPALPGMEWTSWNFNLGFSWQYNASIGDEADRKQPSVLKFQPGASVKGQFTEGKGGFFFAPGGWFSWGAEDLEQGIARPSEDAERDHMKVLGLMLDGFFGYGWNLGGITLDFMFGPSFYARFPLWTAQLGTAEPADFWKAYYAKGEFLHLGLAFDVLFPLSEQMDFGAGIRIYQPLSGFWTEAPAFHGFQAGLLARIAFHIPSE